MLIRYIPKRDFKSFQSQINSLFEDTLVPAAVFEKGLVKVPPAELNETADAIHLKIELPGIVAKDLDVQVTEKAVAISGERKSETKTEDKGITKTEFHYGKFQRVIPLRARIQNDKVQAEYKDGILNLTLPKTTEEKNKVVKVSLDKEVA